jgi:CBS domain-containing protein
MKIEAILKAKGSRVATVRPDMTVATACHRLKMEKVGALVVSNDGRTMLGMITERDIMQCLAAQGPALLEERVEEVMSVGMPCCSREDTVNKVMAQMTRERTRYLPVVERGLLCGIISIGDVVRARVSEVELETRVLRDAYSAVHSTGMP